MTIAINGMHGMGDNFHQRAVVRKLLERDPDLWLETPWPTLYHDLPVRCISKGSRLRTQAKNAIRQSHLFDVRRPPTGAKVLDIGYAPALVKSEGSVLAAMSRQCGVEVGDFRMDVPHSWRQKAFAKVLQHIPADDMRPIMFFRPLVERKEWSGCAARNPDFQAWHELFRSIAPLFHVVSVADLVPNLEWSVMDLEADQTFHAGQLDLETMVGLISVAGLAFSSPGFAIPMAQAVGTPSVCVFGGYENGTSFAAGARFAPHLAIEPINPCQCFQHFHDCQKAIDIPAARAALADFLDTHMTP